jgi:hypothetical protein
LAENLENEPEDYRDSMLLADVEKLMPMSNDYDIIIDFALILIKQKHKKN